MRSGELRVGKFGLALEVFQLSIAGSCVTLFTSSSFKSRDSLLLKAVIHGDRAPTDGHPTGFGPERVRRGSLSF